MVKRGISQYLWSCGVALALVALLYWFSSLWPVSPADDLLAPGMLLAFVAFPQGPHSGHGLVYIFLAMLIDVLLYGGLVMLVWRAIVRIRATKRSPL